MKQHTFFAAFLLLLFGLAGCGQQQEQGANAGDGKRSEAGVRQTGFPGQVTAGGNSSGAVMAQAKSASPAPPTATAAPAPANEQSPREGLRGQAPRGDVSGTPGIPEGSGGTPSGAEMGGTTPGAAASQLPQAPVISTSGKTGADADEQKKQQAAAKAEQEKRDLAAAMDSVAARWRSRAKEQGVKTSGSSADAQGMPSGESAAAKDEVRPLPQSAIRSEKFGTAPPSEDVKNPAEKGK
ncbi:MAG TPA: hypothetical protein VIG66_03225 [Noviherbaspirillum sp.]